MMTLQELKLLGEFVSAALQAGLIRTVEGASGAARCAGILQREVANLVALSESEKAKASGELKRLAERGARAEREEREDADIAAKMEAETLLDYQKHVDSGAGGGFDGLCAPSHLTDEASGDLGPGSSAIAEFEAGAMDLAKTA